MSILYDNIFNPLTMQCMFLFVEFQYKKSVTLSRNELVFYYQRMTPFGVCLALLEEFDKELVKNPTYSILPLIRPTQSNAEPLMRSQQAGEEELANVVNLVKNSLRRAADVPSAGQQVISHDALDVATVNDAGATVLCRPSHAARNVIEDIITNGFKRKSNESAEDADTRELKQLKLGQLIALSTVEGATINVDTKTKKQYINAICSKGKLIECSTGVLEAEGVVGGGECDEKKALGFLTLKQLKMIALVEKIDVVGRRTKSDYVNVIWLARNPL